MRGDAGEEVRIDPNFPPGAYLTIREARETPAEEKSQTCKRRGYASRDLRGGERFLQSKGHLNPK